MPIPVIAGLGWLGSLIGGIVTTLIAAWGTRLAQRLINIALVVTALIAVTAAFYVSMQAVVSTITPAMPPQFNAAVGMFMPSNATACLSAILTAYTLRWLYDWKVKIISMKGQGA